MDSPLVQAKDAAAQKDSISADNEHSDSPSAKSTAVPSSSSCVSAELDEPMGTSFDKTLSEDDSCDPEKLRSSRKRTATDCLPMNAEIKRIGVEISDEQAQQLKNDITRLSPVHVSLHEKTLEEVSLTTDNCTNPSVSSELNSSTSKCNDSPARQLMLVLSRVDMCDNKLPTKKKKKKKRDEDPKMEGCGEDVETPTRRSCRIEAQATLDVDKYNHLSNKSPSERFTVERLEENEEFKLKDGEALKVTMSSSAKVEGDEESSFSGAVPKKLDFSGSDQVEIHPGDAEETETGSEGSEDVTSTSRIEFRSCDNLETPAEEMSCQDSDPLDEMPMIVLRRLELERPEVFTEDSAESLALATGARDEVRSDGSDSGLGSEIPGDLGVVPAPESDSETSFLDKIPEDVLLSKGTSGQLSASTPPAQRYPMKSNLKRRLADCLNEGLKTSADLPTKKKRNIQFDAVTVYYFPRSQGFTCVPSQGGSTLGMSATHTHAERYSLSEHAAEQRRVHRARLAQLRSERAANCVVEAASSSEDPSDDTDEEPSDPEELDIDSYYFLQPVPTWQRRALLRAAGVRRIDAMEKDDCRDIRASREHCGCGCKGFCDPESCPCSRANVKCQVDRAGFPCGCSRDGCANSSGRIEFNPVRVRTHFIHTLMRLEIEKKHHEDETSSGNGPLHEIGVMETPAEACMNPHSGNNFATLHYENPGNRAPRQDLGGVREDSLDLYTTRDDCYGESGVEATQLARGSTFPTFQSSGMAFQQNTYGDYSNYQNLPSTSNVSFQCRGFTHYGISYAPNSAPCGLPTNYETPFAQEESSGSQYTNLNSVHQPMNTVVHQMGKLEPFSELLAGRYSYFDAAAETPSHVEYEKSEEEKAAENVAQAEQNPEDCDENFGEIIKKSMVETVSA